jgi:threonine dehydrogenase-like Zn-dependent dehydrogenase
MNALVIREPGNVVIETVPEPVRRDGEVLLRVRMIGLCGSDLNSFRGKKPLVRFPRIPGHEIAATVVDTGSLKDAIPVGVDVTLSPYTNCGRCASCLRGRPNACQHNETLGVQRDGALTAFISVPPEQLYRANLTIKELCLVELTVGCHAAAGAASRTPIALLPSAVVVSARAMPPPVLLARHCRRSG